MLSSATIISGETIVILAALGLGGLMFLSLLAGARWAVVKQAEQAEEEARLQAEQARRETEQTIPAAKST